MHLLKKSILFTGYILLVPVCFAQTGVLEKIDSLIAIRDVEKAMEMLQNIDTSRLGNYKKAQYYFLLGKSENLQNNHDQGFSNFMIARKHFRSTDSLGKVAEVNLQIVQTLSATEYSELDYQPFIEEYLEYAVSRNDPALLSQAYMQLGKGFMAASPETTLSYFKKALEENQKTSDSLMKAKIHHNIGVVFAEYTTHRDSALYHYNEALKEYEKRGLTDFISYIYNNKARVYKLQEKYDEAIKNYLMADSLEVKEFKKENKRLLYGHLADAYEKNRDSDNALKYLKLQNVYRDSIMQDEQNTAMLDIQTKYEVEKKENENLRLKRNRTYYIITLVILILILIIGYLAYKNLNSRKKLAEKESEVQKQKLEKLLTEQEMAGIDAMVMGQEKERQRIANDLHDNLGGLLAALKLHFQNLRAKKNRGKEEEEQLMEQTNNLINEAYQQVRNIAHTKHAGVHVQEGLLPAVRNFASKVSVSNRIEIEVEDNNMNERLENSLELTLFRIIQELITNVIKHSEATEAVIYFTRHTNFLNILVEDNGIGFDSAHVKADRGMGLYSIQKRMEALGGTVTIDSIPGNGTNVIIDIPIE